MNYWIIAGLGQARIAGKFQQLTELICNELDITYEELTSKRRKKYMVDARMMFVALAYEPEKISLKTLGEFFDNRDHTSVYYYIKKHNHIIELNNRNEEYEREYVDRFNMIKFKFNKQSRN